MQRHSLTTSHEQTNAQPVSEQWLLSKTYSQAFIAEHDLIWCGISFGSVGVSRPGSVPSQPLAYPQLTCCGGRVRNKEGLDAVQALLSNS